MSYPACPTCRGIGIFKKRLEIDGKVHLVRCRACRGSRVHRPALMRELDVKGGVRFRKYLVSRGKESIGVL